MNKVKNVVIGSATLVHGDCLDVDIKGILISDPPYGIGFKYDEHDDSPESYSKILEVFKDKKSILLQYPEETMKYLVPVLGVPDDCVAWCYNSNTNRQFRLWSFFGIKPDFDAYKIPSKNPEDKRVSAFVRSYDWFDDIQQVKNVSEEKTDHPCQVSSKMMERIVLLSGAESVCDPYMGSGSTGVACLRHGVSFLGIEKSERYFDIACERIEKEYNQARLF